MQAIVDRDIVIAIGRGTVTIPDDYPRDVGWERLRWDGNVIIDLATLPGMWVELSGGRFVLHCKEFPGCVYIEMPYASRKLLYWDGAIKLKTPEQVISEQYAEQVEAVKNFLASRVVSPRELAEVIMVLAGLLAVTAIYARTGNEAAGQYITGILPQLTAMPLQKIAGIAPNAYATLKTVFDLYFSKMESIQ